MVVQAGVTILNIGLNLDHGAVGQDQAGVHGGTLVIALAVLIVVSAHGQDIGVIVSHGGLIFL